jgi:hypothetical protein
VFGLGLASWLCGFALLYRSGTWAPFAFSGAALAAAAIGTDDAVRALLRPSLGKVAAGVAAGLLLVAATHAGFAIASRWLPALRAATGRLFVLLEVGGFAQGERAALIVLIASCEEVIFRGALLGRAEPPWPPWTWRLARGEWLRLAAFAALYALAMATLGSWLLLLVGFACALAWGWLRLATRSLVPPILAHVTWDLGVLVLWPLLPSS